MTKKLALCFAVLLALPGTVLAEEATVEVSGAVAAGIEQVHTNTGSSKLNEYRDLRNGFWVYDLEFEALGWGQGRYLELRGDHISRADQSLSLGVGRYGVWSLDAGWTEIPHLFSNKAQTPYAYEGGGLFEVPSAIPITFKKLATVAADAANVLAMDDLVADFLIDNVRPTGLGTQRKRGELAWTYMGHDAFDLRVDYGNEQRSGNRITYGPIGDRPPRSLNIQFTEPVDYRTQDASVTFDRNGRSYQFRASYALSDFDNGTDTLTWQNIFATPNPGDSFDTWDRLVSAYGRRPLAPDNRAHQVQLALGIDGPRDGRLDAVVAYGRLEQDMTLLPYSFANDVLVSPDLPRTTADAQMDTQHLGLSYSFQAASRLHVRAHFRHDALDNETPEDNWWYVTQDTSNLNGTRSYKNRRVNLAYAHTTQQAGVEGTVRLGFWRSTLGVGLEREDVDRDFREADTDELRLRATWRARPARWVNLRLRGGLDRREADRYDPYVTRLSYWYAPADAGTDNDNPRFTFSNHPDMRKYDVTDRRRDLAEATATFTPRPEFAVTASARYRGDDYDSDVVPTQPLLGTGLAEEAAFTPGDQLGLLKALRRQYTVDAFYSPGERWTWTAFVSMEQLDSRQRSLEYNENNKQNPSAVATAELGPWTRAESQWTAVSDDETRTLGLGADGAIVPDALRLRVNGTYSRGRVDITYAGFGVTNWDGTPFPDNHQFAFRTPPVIEHDLYQIDTAAEMRLFDKARLTLGYLFEKYVVRDWQQETDTPWYESVGSEYLLRDTSRSHQWGNRLPNLGSYLAPGYKAHVIYATLGYRY